MGTVERVQFRRAGPSDAASVASLHALSWRLHYRGAYSDAFLDGDVEGDRLLVWTGRLGTPDAGHATILAEDDGALVGFVHVVFHDDPKGGALIDNLHVDPGSKRQGIGRRLMARAAGAVVTRDRTMGLYLWVLEQNADAQAFYAACGGRCVERALTEPPGDVPGRLNGAPAKLRYVWTDPAALLG